MTFATLMTRAGDEPDAMYGFAARAVQISDDGLIYRYLLRSDAKFHDGSRLTAHDVAFSLNLLKQKGHPIITQLLRDLTSIDADDDRSVTLRFAEKRARDVPLFAASMPIFSRAYYATKPFDESTLDIPLGSGVYKVGRFEQGRFIEFDRVKDWWAKDLPVMRGQYNFDTVRFEYYRDRDVAFEGFTGKNYLFREEFTSRIWATRYDFPAIKDGRVKQEILPDDTPSGAQGWFINTRREKFKNPKLREALIYAFDFEWTNKNIMYGSYDRTHSVFQNSDLMAKGPPSPDEVGHARAVPRQGAGGGVRRTVRAARVRRLRRGPRAAASRRTAVERGGLSDQGRQAHDAERRAPDHRVPAGGAELPAAPHALHQEPADARHRRQPAADRCRADAEPAQRFRFRPDDPASVSRRLSATPGDSLRTFFSSQAAAIKGSQNLAGIADPVIDALIEQVIAAKDRATLTTACRALDRVIRSGRYWIPQWYKGTHWLAYWDMFSHPPQKPRYARGVVETWWYDPEKAAKANRPGQDGK